MQTPVPRVAVVIPARFASSRFPGKPLTKIRGADGIERSLIEHSWRAASGVRGADRVFVATDDARIADEVARVGGEVVMTPPTCANGTERCAAALASIGDKFDVIVNVQGDAPLTPPKIVDALVDRMGREPDLSVATPAVRCSPSVLSHLLEDQRAGRVGGTTVVMNAARRALYFSKRILPYIDERALAGTIPAVHLHLGVYAYRPAALHSYVARPPSALELQEGLEQLRFLDAGIDVGLEVCEAPWDVIEVNNPGDVAQVEAIMRARAA